MSDHERQKRAYTVAIAVVEALEHLDAKNVSALGLLAEWRRQYPTKCECTDIAGGVTCLLCRTDRAIGANR